MQILIETLKREQHYYVWLTFLTDAESLLHFQGISYFRDARDMQVKQYVVLVGTRVKCVLGRIKTLKKKGLPLVKKNSYSNLIPLSSYYKEKMVEWILEVEKR